MFMMRRLWVLCLCGLASSAASAAGDSFVAEGLADPAHLGAKAVGKSPQELEDLLLSQASVDAALHLGIYTRGVQFKQEPGPDGRYAFVTGAAEFQPMAGLSPESKKLRMLKSGLGVADVSYGPGSREHLFLPKAYYSLPIYRVKGEYQNPGEVALSKVSLHWQAVEDAYHEALVEHLAKLYPGKEIVYVRGRVFPVRVIEAELLPAGGSAPGSAAAATSAAATSAAAPAAASSAAKAGGPAPFDSKQFTYRVELDVRIRLDDVKFAEDKSGTSARSAGSAVSAARATSAVPVMPRQEAGASSAAPAAAPGTGQRATPAPAP
jgi:hypothetical protein